MKLPFFFSAGILLFASLCCRAQFYRSWADGPLTRYDFQMPFPENAGNVKDAYISLSLIRENKVVKSQDIVYKYQDIMASIIPGQSWISPEARTEATLARLQKEFDVFQHFASRYRDDYLFYNDLRQDQYENYFPETNKHKLPESWYLEQYRLAVQEIGNTGDASPYPVSREAFDITKVPCRIEEGSTRVLFFGKGKGCSAQNFPSPLSAHTTSDTMKMAAVLTQRELSSALWPITEDTFSRKAKWGLTFLQGPDTPHGNQD